MPHRGCRQSSSVRALYQPEQASGQGRYECLSRMVPTFGLTQCFDLLEGIDHLRVNGCPIEGLRKSFIPEAHSMAGLNSLAHRGQKTLAAYIRQAALQRAPSCAHNLSCTLVCLRVGCSCASAISLIRLETLSTVSSRSSSHASSISSRRPSASG